MWSRLGDYRVRLTDARRIESWFARHAGDGEFQCGQRTFPYTVIEPPRAAGNIIITTKPHSVLAIIERCGVQDRVGLIGRYGLPDAADLDWICRIAGQRRLLFLGDMDAVDLLVFAWLAAHLGGRRVIHMGINDALLITHRMRPLRRLLIECSTSERKSLALLNRVFPTFADIVGPRCAAMLERGEKMELEAVVGAKKAKAAWRRLLLRGPGSP
jgi:hypothetical protein